MSDYTIGITLEHKGEQFRVVRIITNSITLFEDEKGVYLQIESYIELKGLDGSIDFITLTRERNPYEGPTSIAKGLEPINLGGQL
jgi:hypothetical protein